MAQCIHEIETDTCAVCTPRRQPPPPWVTYGAWFPAGYDSDCDGCGGRIHAGDDIRSDGEGGWLCGDCGNTGGPGRFTIKPDGGYL